MAKPNSVTLEDINGVVFNAGITGTQEEDLTELVCWFPSAAECPNGMPFPCEEWGTIAANRAGYRQFLSDVYSINYIQAFENDPDCRNNQEHCMRLAFLKVLAVREGLIYPDTDPTTKHCKYALGRRITVPVAYYCQTQACRAQLEALVATRHTNGVQTGGVLKQHLREYTIAEFGRLFQGDANPFENPVAAAAIQIPTLAANIRKMLTNQFCDLVCSVAYIFRARGHHYRDEYADKYNQIFRGTAFSEGQPDCGLPWKCVARQLCKAIFPIDLDAYWGRCVDASSCSGNLTIRFDGPAAGAASILACRRGLDDLVAAFPNFRTKFQAQITALEACEAAVAGSRWGASINHRYYGVAKIRYDERNLGALASCILAAIRQFAPDAPLKDSKALIRLGSGAPIVGHVCASVLALVSKHEALAAVYLQEGNQVAQQQ